MRTLMIIASGSSIEDILIERILKNTNLKLILYFSNKKKIEKYQNNDRITVIEGNALKTQDLTDAMEAADEIYANISGIDQGAKTKSILVAMDQTDQSHLFLVDTSKNKNGLHESINLLDRFGIDHTEIQPDLSTNQDEGSTEAALSKIANDIIQRISNKEH